MEKKNKTIVIGLDGATWDILQYWIDRETLPNLKKIMKGGVHGTLKSVIPPVTSPAWKCYSTSKNPGKLGVYWWANFDRKKSRLILPSSHSFKSKDLWDYLGEEGKKSAVINMPTTYPPKPIDGVMVSGFGAPIQEKNEEASFTYPRGLKKEIEEKYGYQTTISNPRGYEKDKLGARVRNLIEQRFHLAKELLESGEYDFINVTIFYINSLQHFFGTDEVVKKAWSKIDEHIGEFLEKDVRIVIISDHGTASIKRSIAINNWLLEQGYLSLKRDFGDCIKKIEDEIGNLLGIGEKQIPGKSTKIKYAPGILLSYLIPNTLSDNWIGLMGDIPTSMIDLKINWQKSLAVGLGQGPIYLNTDKLGDDYKAFREKMIKDLKNLRDPKTKDLIFDEVFRKKELYKGDYIEDAPDIILLPKKGYEIHGGITDRIFHKKRIGWTTGNHPDGILLVYGPGIRRGVKINGADILDIAPTILHMMDVPIPKDMDGRVLTEIFEGKSELAEKKVQYRVSDEKGRIKNRIHRLKEMRKI
ncbi:hypothetical protein AKJ44_01470 [candidate division MSBL1 archaeon SCGC-AAA261F17]|uniref:Nucleotide pyrophosphatase n=1 Tax=candidate division MSBL1 archaeon SCGC-AAA261F17 TaxID=1698274 RepID=A0A133V6K7_9EURY|nr:hypothetical protein AKJ44_01470 [candidate division MSBL1 archaeon SCGC-AAA261F17]